MLKRLLLAGLMFLAAGVLNAGPKPGDDERSDLVSAKAASIYEKGNELFKQKDYLASTAEFEKIISEYSGTAAYEPALYLNTIAHFRGDSFERAIFFGDKFIKEFPSSKYLNNVLAVLGQAYYKEADDYQAAFYLIKYYLQTEDTLSRPTAFATVLEILPKLDIAPLEKLHRSYMAEAIDEHILYTLARVELNAGRKKEAQRDFELLIRRFPNTRYSMELDDYMRVISLGETSGRIGVLLPLTGKFAASGQKLLELLNKFEKEKKPPFSVVTQDTKSDAVEAILAANRLAEEKVDFIIGPIFSFEAYGVCGLTYAKGIPVILPVLESRFEAIPLVYTTSPSSEEQARAVARYAVNQMQLSTFAVIYPEITKFKDLAKAFQNEVIKCGKQVAVSVGFNPDSITLRWEMEKIKKQKAEAIFLAMDTDMIINTAPQVVYYQLENVRLLGVEYFHNEKIPRYAEKTVENAVFATTPPMDSTAVIEYRQFAPGDNDFLAIRFFQILWQLQNLPPYNRSTLPGILTEIFQSQQTFYIYTIHNGDFMKLTEVAKEN